MKKMLCVTLAALTALISAGCASGGDISRETAPQKTMFKYGDSFYIPPTPSGCMANFCTAGSDGQSLPAIVDSFFGDGEYSRGSCEHDEMFDDLFEWRTEDGMHEVTMVSNGGVYVIDREVSINESALEDDPDKMPESGGYIFENAFESTSVTLCGAEYTHDELSSIAQGRIMQALAAMGSDMQLSPLYAEVYSSAANGSEYISFTFSAKLFDGALRSCFGNDDYYTDDSGESIPLPICISTVKMYSADSVGGLEIISPVTDISAGESVSVISCEEAIECAGNELFSSSSHMTLNYARFEYTPSEKNGDTYTAEPYWALYYTDDSNNCGVICVSAVSGSVRLMAL